MFNSALKKRSIERLEEASNKYQNKSELVKQDSIKLFESRKMASGLIKKIEAYINLLANTPKEFDSKIEKIKINTRQFNAILNLEIEDKRNKKISGSVAGGGVAMGVGVAAFGPTAAMAFATTFGTASTGALISTLSGAAYTNAALAFLGGGAIAAGGGGMAAGEALLALAGPVGWAIGGAAIVGGGLIISSKNKKIAERAENEAIKIEKQIAALLAIHTEIKEINNLTDIHTNDLHTQLNMVSNYGLSNYLEFSTEQRYELGALVNNALALSKLLNRKIGQEHEKSA